MTLFIYLFLSISIVWYSSVIVLTVEENEMKRTLFCLKSVFPSFERQIDSLRSKLCTDGYYEIIRPSVRSYRLGAINTPVTPRLIIIQPLIAVANSSSGVTTRPIISNGTSRAAIQERTTVFGSIKATTVILPTQSRTGPKLDPSEDTFPEEFYDEEESYPAPRQKTEQNSTIDPLSSEVEIISFEKIIVNSSSLIN